MSISFTDQRHRLALRKFVLNYVLDNEPTASAAEVLALIDTAIKELKFEAVSSPQKSPLDRKVKRAMVIKDDLASVG